MATIANSSYQPKVYREQGGDRMVVASGGEIRVDPGGALRLDGSQMKVFNRETGTTDAFALQAKSEPTSPTAGHALVEATCDWEPSTAAQAGSGVRAVQGVSTLQTTKTVEGGSIIGLYGQVQNNGTINGSGVMLSSVYGLVEEGAGTYTAVSHLSAAWLDSHLDDAVSSGETEFLYISNNGDTTFNQAIYVYGGNKITNLLNINTASGMVSANTAGGSTLNFTNWKTIKIVIDGETYYLVAAKTIA